MQARNRPVDPHQLEEIEVHERSSPSGRIVYRAIMKEGEEELERSSQALFWSGLAAGLSMGFSLIMEGLLYAYLPDKPWRPLVSRLGYSVGFLVVILGRQQLFTENTLTGILPLLKKPDAKRFGNVLRLWAVVLLANIIGAMALAWVVARTPALDPQVRAAFVEIGHESMKHGFGTVVLKAIFAGWLIALVVWLMPFAESAHFWVILTITYVIGLGSFSHVIAGSVKVFTLAAAGEKSWGAVWSSFVLPALIGNIIGGVTLVAAINHAQVTAGGDHEHI